jgi:DNA-directed RNA polymerase specialized sigma24 family protein
MDAVPKETVWKVAANFDWGALSPEAKETLSTIAVPVGLGMQQKEVAAQLGVSASTVAGRMRKLRRELLEQIEP